MRAIATVCTSGATRPAAAQHAASSIQPQHIAAPAVRTVGRPHIARPPRIALQALIVGAAPWQTEHRRAVATVRLIIGAADLVGVRGEFVPVRGTSPQCDIHVNVSTNVSADPSRDT